MRIFDPDYPERAVVAAGAPWFMTLFGRDSLITSWFALIVDPDLALGVLQTLARFQGRQVVRLKGGVVSTLTYERRQELVKAAHRQRNREIWRLIDRLIARLTAEPKLRSSRWIAAHRGW